MEEKFHEAIISTHEPAIMEFFGRVRFLDKGFSKVYVICNIKGELEDMHFGLLINGDNMEFQTPEGHWIRRPWAIFHVSYYSRFHFGTLDQVLNGYVKLYHPHPQVFRYKSEFKIHGLKVKEILPYLKDHYGKCAYTAAKLLEAHGIQDPILTPLISIREALDAKIKEKGKQGVLDQYKKYFEKLEFNTDPDYLKAIPVSLQSNFADASDCMIKGRHLVPEFKALMLYGYFKQVGWGDCKVPKPVTGEENWKAWKAMEGLNKEAAMAAYIELVESVGPLKAMRKRTMMLH